MSQNHTFFVSLAQLVTVSKAIDHKIKNAPWFLSIMKSLI